MHQSTRYTGYTIIGLVAIIGCGLIAATLFARDIDRTQRQVLLEQTQYASLLVTPLDIASLTGTDIDLDNPTYQRLKSQFSIFRSYNSNIRFVYIMGYRPELQKQFFYLDSEPTASEDYSPPGQIFEDTRQTDIDKYLNGEPYTDGPYRDSWGEWISGGKPILDENGNTVALVGIDIATSVWHKQIAFAYTTTGIIVALLGVLFIVFIRKLKRKQYSIEDLTSENRNLQYNENSLRELQHMARLGKIIFYFPERTVKVDEQFSFIFGKTDQILSLNQFLSFVHPDDQQKVTDGFSEIMTSDIKYSWLDIRIGSPDIGYRLYHVYGNIERGAKTIFSGIMQDISDIEQ